MVSLDEITRQGRKIGSAITKITCGEFVDGNPIIVVGETFVKADSPSGQLADKRTFPQEEETVLYMAGVYKTTRHFIALLDGPSFRPQSTDPNLNDGDRAVRADILSNESAKAALNRWYTAPSAWSPTDVKALFVPTFASVEQHFSDIVGRPNNVIILTTCGRLETTVEADWPTCPPPKTPLTKKSKKSSAKVKGSKPST